MTLGLYLHLPWCLSRCTYCDFNAYAEEDASLKAAYHAALLREIQVRSAALGHPPADTLYLGGGTPTTLPATWLVELVAAAQSSFRLPPDAEVTTEANPGTVSLASLRELREGGVNRLSLGVQSLDDRELRFLSRRHDAETARRAVAQARRAGFGNLSLDLIFNLPGQTLSRWRANLRAAIRLAPDHFSLYSLTVEPGTPLYRQVTAGDVALPDDDLAADMYAEAQEMLAQAGYAHYEISNWARSEGEAEWQTPRLASAHNLIYWRNQPYLGLGAGAWSTLGGERYAHLKQPRQYLAAGPLARDAETLERIDRDTAMFEQMMLGLRLTREGVSALEFEARFGVSLLEQYPAAVAFGLKRGLSEWVEAPGGPRLRLTRQGRFVANQVIGAFMVV